MKNILWIMLVGLIVLNATESFAGVSASRSFKLSVTLPSSVASEESQLARRAPQREPVRRPRLNQETIEEEVLRRGQLTRVRSTVVR